VLDEGGRTAAPLVTDGTAMSPGACRGRTWGGAPGRKDAPMEQPTSKPALRALVYRRLDG